MATPGSDPAVDAQSRSSLVIAICISFAILSFFIVALRLYVRVVLLKALGPDDWTICVAQVLAIVVSMTTISEAKFALGRHIWTLPPDRIHKQLKALYVNIIIHNLGMNLIKISFLLQYRRIFSTKTMKRVTLLLLCVISTWTVVQLPVLALTCFPLSAIVPSMADTCLPTFPSWYFTTYFHIATDFIIFIVPLPTVFSLNMGWRRKLCLVAILSMGLFTCIISIIRATTLHQCLVTPDPTWDTTDAAWWTVVEINCAIICASLATLRPLLGKLVPSFNSKLTDGSNKSYTVTRPNRMTFERMPTASGGGSNNNLALDEFPVPKQGNFVREPDSKYGVQAEIYASTADLKAVEADHQEGVPDTTYKPNIKVTYEVAMTSEVSGRLAGRGRMRSND
ncbi:hypothetical protein BGZ61DRAFT_527676 [Ilyonectria robusta]|uniref:uncharacterized protein n=1 Tax=Ilyonectria robusta TaxID=1079257 RepID=UPI001E8E95E4|nr:uncharacterized protein BGZ61DRAFT_527676 [Ilyonectria robusta]KAH8734319.1 hypothetical protein BGZ61DRAFT_527676 [Ilyonectria robusta]